MLLCPRKATTNIDNSCTVLGTLFLVALTNTSVFGTVNLTLGFWCFSLALNVIATVLIVGRLVYHRYQLKRVLGSQHAGHYTSFIATVVESELLYTCYLILYIVPFILNNTLVNAFIQGPSVIQVRLLSLKSHKREDRH